MNGGFWDLPVEERGHWYDKAEQDTGQSFWDLPASEYSALTAAWRALIQARRDAAPAVWPDQTHDGQRARAVETADVAGEVL